MPPRSPFAPHPWQVLLRERHNIEVPVNTWNNPPSTLVRISAQLYNDIDQYKLLAGALVEILADA
jgi:selenocysteine lyase/cysteine desulfurase